jgi:hypothetical protein
MCGVVAVVVVVVIVVVVVVVVCVVCLLLSAKYLLPVFGVGALRIALTSGARRHACKTSEPRIFNHDYYIPTMLSRRAPDCAKLPERANFVLTRIPLILNNT